MTVDLNTLVAQAWASVSRPREVARWVMSFDLPRLSRWEALLLVVIISAIIAQLTVMFIARPEAVVFSQVLMNPWTSGIVQMSVLVVAVFAIYWVGRAMGGMGGFGDAILLVAWLQFCMVCLQVLQTALLVLFPPLGSLVGMAGFVLFFWLLSNFVAELHGFQSVAQVFLMVLVTLIGIVFGLSLILTLIGITLPGTPQNV